MWARIKWNVKVKSAFITNSEKVDAWLDKKGIKGIIVPDTLEEEFLAWSKKEHRVDLRDSLKIRNYKAWYIRTMTWWAFNMIWTCTHDLIKNVGTTIYNYMARALQGDSDRIFKAMRDQNPKP